MRSSCTHTKAGNTRRNRGLEATKFCKVDTTFSVCRKTGKISLRGGPDGEVVFSSPWRMILLLLLSLLSLGDDVDGNADVVDVAVPFSLP